MRGVALRRRILNFLGVVYSMSSDKNRNTKRILSALFGMTVAFNGNFTAADNKTINKKFRSEQEVNKSDGRDKRKSVKNKTENMSNKTKQDKGSLGNSKDSSKTGDGKFSNEHERNKSDKRDEHELVESKTENALSETEQDEGSSKNSNSSGSFISRHPVLTALGVLLTAGVVSAVVYSKVNGDAEISIDFSLLRDMSSKVPERLYGLKSAIDEKLEDLKASNKKNAYSLLYTGARRIVAGFKNKTAIERALESSALYSQEKRNVTCWDASLAFLYYIYSEYGPQGRQPERFADMKVGLMSYDIPITFGLANHTFCYVIVGNTLFIVDPLLGASICIDLNGDRDVITAQISMFYSVQKEANVMPGLGDLYKFFNNGASRIGNAFASNNIHSPYGKDGVYVSDDIFKSDNTKLSNVKWMPDFEFFGNLLAGMRNFSAADFVWRAPGLLFG